MKKSVFLMLVCALLLIGCGSSQDSKSKSTSEPSIESKTEIAYENGYDDGYNEGYEAGLKRAAEEIKDAGWLPMAEDGTAMIEEYLNGYETKDWARDGLEYIRDYLSSISGVIDDLEDGRA